MTTDEVKRKLTAIFSADVVGYSRLMGEDELATVQTLTSYKETMTKLIRHYRGRVLDSIGDNLMAEFASVVDAVQCAVEVQQVLSSKNEELPENRKMLFRIGINLGDVIEEGDRIYGDGVNIAARVESLAEGGGVCISGSAFEQIENKLALGYQYMGEHTVKNIAKPVKVYRVPTEPYPRKEKERWFRGWRRVASVVVAMVILGAVVFAIWNFYIRPAFEPASAERMAFPLPEKPSIAVLPFVNMSGDPNRDFISDGLTDQIITYLSMNPDMFVIASNSAFTYKGKPVKIQKVAEELGVRYVLEGSVQSVGDRLRIAAQLIDALTGRHLWAERYDRDLKDIFAIQDEITVKVFDELQVKLISGEEWRRHTLPRNLDYIEKKVKAWSYFVLLNPESNEQARRMYEEAITLEPEAAFAYNMLGWTHFLSVVFGTSKSPGKDIERAFELAQRAIALDDSYGHPHCLLGYIYLYYHRQYEKAVSEVEQAVALSPNDADARAHMANIFNYVGRREEAINLAKQAIRLNPFPQPYYFNFLGDALCLAGRYDEAIEAHKKALHLNPNSRASKQSLAIAYSLSGREEEARAMAAEVLMINPKFSLARFAKITPYRNQEDTDRIVNALRKAGLK